MLRLASFFFIAALLAATCGFSGITPGIAPVAKKFFLIFFILMSVTVVLHMLVVRKRVIERGEL